MMISSEAEKILGTIENYALAHIHEPMTIDFPEDDSYRCLYLTNNWDNNDEDMDDPKYEEWASLIFDVIEILRPSPNKDARYDSITISEKRMPLKVTCNNEVVYEFGNDPD